MVVQREAPVGSIKDSIGEGDKVRACKECVVDGASTPPLRVEGREKWLAQGGCYVVQRYGDGPITKWCMRAVSVVPSGVEVSNQNAGAVRT